MKRVVKGKERITTTITTRGDACLRTLKPNAYTEMKSRSVGTAAIGEADSDNHREREREREEEIVERGKHCRNGKRCSELVLLLAMNGGQSPCLSNSVEATLPTTLLDPGEKPCFFFLAFSCSSNSVNSPLHSRWKHFSLYKV